MYIRFKSCFLDGGNKSFADNGLEKDRNLIVPLPAWWYRVCSQNKASAPKLSLWYLVIIQQYCANETNSEQPAKEYWWELERHRTCLYHSVYASQKNLQMIESVWMVLWGTHTIMSSTISPRFSIAGTLTDEVSSFVNDVINHHNIRIWIDPRNRIEIEKRDENGNGFLPGQR